MSFRFGEIKRRVYVAPGSCIAIQVGSRFSVPYIGEKPVAAISVTMPPWPGKGEAVRADGPWIATVPPGPELAGPDNESEGP
jgi:mannose-6-phosphate isomerase-like protein (cupin superfamily)